MPVGRLLLRRHAVPEAGLALLPKPEACQGCPAYGTGMGFVADEIRPQAPVMLYFQGPGQDEEVGQRFLGQDQYESAPPAPMLGRTGRMLGKDFLPLAGLTREDCSLGNALRCRWPGRGNQLPDLNRREMQAALAHCTRVHFRRPEGAKVFVAGGEYATSALTGISRNFSGWRGYMAPLHLPGDPLIPMTSVWDPSQDTRPPVFITHHLAYLFREPTASLPAKRDWNKLALILNGKWPVRMSPIESEPPDPWPSYAAFDTEFAEDQHDRLVRYSLATRDRKVWVVEADRARSVATLPDTTVIMHNAPADLPHLKGLIALDRVVIEDTMYAHACLWTGKTETDEEGQARSTGGGAMSHTLNFLGSMYAWINRWKHLVKVSPRLYAGGDALGTMDVWTTGLNGGLLGELDRDPETKWVYENLQKPLVGIVLKHHQRGIAVDSAAVKRALGGLESRQHSYSLQAQAYCGFPINLRSPAQVAYYLYDVEGLKVKRGRR